MSSYMLMPSAGVTPLAAKGSSLYNRAEVLYHHFWATPYDANEMYPAGEFPASNQKAAGLPTWTEANRSLENTDWLPGTWRELPTLCDRKNGPS